MVQTRHPSKSWFFKNCFSFKFRQHGKQQLYLQYKVSWILYKLVVAPSFSKPYLCIKPMLQSPPNYSSSTSVRFHLPPLLNHKIILTIPTNTPFLYTSAIFHHFLRTIIPTIYTKGISLSQPFHQFRLCQGTRELGHCVNLPLVKVWTVITGLTITDSLLLRIIQLGYCRCGKSFHPPSLIPSNLLSLLPYPTNTTARTRISLETSCLIWFKFSILIY